MPKHGTLKLKQKLTKNKSNSFIIAFIKCGKNQISKVKYMKVYTITLPKSLNPVKTNPNNLTGRKLQALMLADPKMLKIHQSKESLQPLWLFFTLLLASCFGLLVNFLVLKGLPINSSHVYLSGQKCFLH